MAEQPSLYRDKNKDVRRNPLLFVVRQWSEELMRLSALLGFSPVARARIGMAAVGGTPDLPGDPWDDLAST
ncbi:MAG: P27 family phage terminase small subunit [Vicinamibacterales bacterium]